MQQEHAQAHAKAHPKAHPKAARQYLVQVDELACTAHGDCVDIAPGVFELDDVARVTGDGPPDLIMRAAEACPSVAIIVTDAETGEQVFP